VYSRKRRAVCTKTYLSDTLMLIFGKVTNVATPYLAITINLRSFSWGQRPSFIHIITN
jgi:hypothetical protein